MGLSVPTAREKKDVQAQELEQGLGYHTPSSLLTPLSPTPDFTECPSCNQTASGISSPEASGSSPVGLAQKTQAPTWGLIKYGKLTY